MAAACLIVFSLFAVGCTTRPNVAERSAVKVTTLTVGATDTPETRRYTGSVEAAEGTVVSFEAGGHVTGLFADVGDRVVSGQRLGTIDPSELKSLHDAALAALEQARDAHRRYAVLHREGTLPDIKWQEVESRYKQAEAAERVAREKLSDCVLHAPVSGYVAERPVDAGSNVAPGQPVFRIVDIRRVNVRMAVPEGEISTLSVGQSVSFSVGALNGSTFAARISEKGVTADPLSHTYTVKATVDNADGKLLPGMVCDVTAEFPRGEGRIVVPSRAVSPDIDGEKFVWLDVKGRAERRTVTTGDFVEGGVVVTGGLQPGDKVVIEGGQKISTGMKIQSAS